VALTSLLVERFRAVRSARVSLEGTTVLFGENACGMSSLLEALALVLSPLDGGRPRIQSWQFHRATEAAGSAPTGPVRIQATFTETRAGSWDRPELEALAPVLDRGRQARRRLILELTAGPAAGNEAVEADWIVRSPGGRPSHNEAAVLQAVRRLNPFVWLRGGEVVGLPVRDRGVEAGPTGAPGLALDATEVLSRYHRLIEGATWSREAELEAGYAAAARLLATWAPDALDRRPAPRASVAEILGRSLEAPAGPRTGPSPEAPLPSSLAQKLGVFILTARVFEQLRDAAPGVRPIIVLEDVESGLHPMTLAAAWSLLERLSTQKIITTNSGTVLAAAPLRSLRRLVRGGDGVVREWRVREGTLGRDDLRRVSYHLRARRGAACFARCWLLVEGETEFWLLPDLARLCGYDLVQEGVACVEFAQCGLRPLIKLAEALGIEWHVLVDGDAAGESYQRLAGGFVRRGDPSRRITVLDDRDIEHCFWRHGYAAVFERLAGTSAGPGGPAPRRIIGKALDRHSKPGVAFELLAAVGAGDSPGPPAPLRRTIEACVALARRP
jgi:putative ATP-dependent endonuclease of OLD family